MRRKLRNCEISELSLLDAKHTVNPSLHTITLRLNLSGEGSKSESLMIQTTAETPVCFSSNPPPKKLCCSRRLNTCTFEKTIFTLHLVAVLWSFQTYHMILISRWEHFMFHILIFFSLLHDFLSLGAFVKFILDLGNPFYIHWTVYDNSSDLMCCPSSAAFTTFTIT